jgi:PPOX class probable F420-dependent enzyme
MQAIPEFSPHPGPLPQGEREILSDEQRRFLSCRRVAHLATADRGGRPHVVPVCFVLAGEAAYITIDAKPKGPGPLKRVRNIRENPAVALVTDRYDEDWSLLGWVMLRGRGEMLDAGAEHDRAQALLRERYPQLRAMRIEHLPVIAIRIERASSWGNLSA